MEDKGTSARIRAGRAALIACVLALLISVLPLYAISLYNHPYYDDYTFSAKVHHAWRQTGSLAAVTEAAWKSAGEVRATWQGTYLGTLLSNVQPGVFSEDLYFISSLILITAFLGCFWFFFATVMGGRGLGLTRYETAVLSCLALAVMTQFMPDAGEAFYWFNGGIGNLFVYSLLALSAALFLRLAKAEARRNKAGLTALLALLMVALGGGSYGGGLFGLCALALATVWLFARRNGAKWRFLLLWLLFALCFLYSVSAPGNGVRSHVIGIAPSPLKTVVRACYEGVALMGAYLRLPVIGVTLLVLPFFARAAGKSAWSFAHPWRTLLVGGGLFCAQLAPPLYGVFSMGGGRIVNTYWVSFVALWLLYAYYLTGFAIKRAPVCARLINRRGVAVAGVCALLVGCLAYKPVDEPLYGAQNMTGVSAAISVLSGEAAEYDREMDERERLLNDASLPMVTLKPLTKVPDVFMDDLIVPNALYDVRPALYTYYGKTLIAVEGEEAQP